jgi:hypothetical protein
MLAVGRPGSRLGHAPLGKHPPAKGIVPARCPEGSTLLRIHHETKLTFTGPVYEAVLEVRMASSSDEDQTNLGYQLRTTPAVPGTPAL